MNKSIKLSLALDENSIQETVDMISDLYKKIEEANFLAEKLASSLHDLKIEIKF
ncbi:Uncharacterised protein [uncultured Ruminococcus sp.]|jgi:hypothetical protein|nr:Uncharacterised protein [uncultured Clostridium sp.]SCH77217.1 Uncharacterised protein [uncultured Ruminococcus sp.]DAP83186.1 MAG TPA: hypothetical protein [Caudoviricetes sp.]